MTEQPSRIALPRHIQGALEFVHAHDLSLRREGLGIVSYYRLWLHTNDYVLGTFLELLPNGQVNRVTIREGEGDDRVLVRPVGG